ncbi:chorismate mutase [Telmatospirillum sp. J64-1]|uniref:chorismate mutase n=1 Tax=Telmatospirillum sp. J64-1 TaxID=2502183 RepID=UPI00115F2E65|nr:chorismate mutase [Telmatospirillum sp. J64-1]
MTAAPGNAKICNSLQEIRDNIDRLDDQIVALLSERSGYVHQAAGFKETRANVVVPERIEAIATRVRGLAESHKADPDLMEAIYRAMIDCYIAYEDSVWARTRSEEAVKE